MSYLNKLWGLNLEYEEHPESSAEGGDGKEEGHSEPKSHPQWNSRKKWDRMDFWNQVDQDLEETVFFWINSNPDLTHP